MTKLTTRSRPETTVTETGLTAPLLDVETK